MWRQPIAPRRRITWARALNPELALAQFRRQLLERGNAVLSGRMRRKELVHAVVRQRIDDEKVRGGRGALGSGEIGRPGHSRGFPVR